MGLETILLIGTAVVAVGSSIYALVMTGNMKDKMKRDLMSLDITKAEEGSVIPLVYGTKITLPGHLVWYGNIKYRKYKPAGAKGGGGNSDTGQRYVIVDAHIILGHGRLLLRRILKDKEEYNPDATLYFNDGTETTYQGYSTNVNSSKGISHIFLKNWNLGVNATSIPSLLFEVDRIEDTGLDPELEMIIENPADIIAELLEIAGESIDSTNLAEMQGEWTGPGYKLSFKIDSQQDLPEILDKILFHVDGYMWKVGTSWFLGSWNKIDTPTPINFEDIKDFQLTRKSFSECYSDITVTYIDLEHTKRTARQVNEAVYQLSNLRKNYAVDLSFLRTVDDVEVRLATLLQRESSPFAEVSFTTNLKHYELHVGSQILLDGQLGIDDTQFLITKISRGIRSCEIKITAIETTEKLGYPLASDTAETEYEDEDWTVEALDNVLALTLKYGSRRGFSDIYTPVLIVAEKKTGKEEFFEVWYSFNDIDFIKAGESWTWAYAGNIEEEYIAGTRQIDDEIGILIDFDENEYALDSLTRMELFLSNRVLISNGEMMKFQTVTEEGTFLRLTGVLREDTRSAHTIDATAFITEVDDNVFLLPKTSNLSIRVLPVSRSDRLGIESVLSVFHNTENKPYPVGKIEAVRSGSDVDFFICPDTQLAQGASFGNPDFINKAEYAGKIVYSVDGFSTETILESNIVEFSISDAGAISLDCKARVYGKESEVTSIFVDTSDGKYTGYFI